MVSGLKGLVGEQEANAQGMTLWQAAPSRTFPVGLISCLGTYRVGQLPLSVYFLKNNTLYCILSHSNEGRATS